MTESVIRVGHDHLRVGKILISKGQLVEIRVDGGRKIKGRWKPVLGKLFGLVGRTEITMDTDVRVIEEE